MPALDGVAFIDPRKSQVDIVQAVGRAIRKSDNKTHGIIVIPVFIGNSDNPDSELEQSRYKPIWDVLNALRSHDDVLAKELDKFRTSLGRMEGGFKEEFSKFEFVLPRTVSDQFVTALKTRIVEVTTVSWHFWYGLLLNYVEEYGHARVPLRIIYETCNLGAWVSNQKANHKNGKLDFERIKMLEALPKWSWDVFEDQWNEGFEYLKKYIQEHGHARVPTQLKYENFNLGSWASHRRKEKNKLSLEKIKLLESLPKWSWDVFEDQWNEGFEYLKKYIQEHGHARIPTRLKYENFNLGSWVSTRRKTRESLDLEKIQLLESLPQWSWNPIDDQWDEGFSCLKKYVEEQGHARIPAELKYQNFNLGSWVNTQRLGRDNLVLKRIQLLEELPKWSWDPLEDKWNEGFSCLKKYVEENGHAIVPRELKYQNFNLGSWVGSQRLRKEQLDFKRIQLLESLPKWSWDAHEDKWNEGFNCLKKYVEENGHARVPRELKYQNFNLGTWVGSQRLRKEKLDLKRIQLLKSLPKWSWDAHEDKWNEGFEYLKKYIQEHGHARVPTQLKYENFNLGSWVSHQRTYKYKLGLEKIQQLEASPRWSWDVNEGQWNEGFEYLKKYVEEYGHARVPDRLKYQNFNLGTWLSNQRKSKDKLDLEKIQQLESLILWSWDVFENQWKEGFEYLKKYAEEQGNARVPQGYKYGNFNLGSWVSKQRAEKDKFDLERIQLFEALPGWSWNVFEDKWHEGFEYLKKYVEEQGHANVPTVLKYQNFNLGTWVNRQRLKKDKLDLRRLKLLEELPQWSWNPLEDQWNEGFEYLKKYAEEYGHARVPRGFKYESYNLGTWIGTQRRDKDKLNLERIKMLESLPRWSWGKKSE